MRNIYEKIVFAYTDLADKLLPVGRLVRRNPYVMIFKTTNYCGYKCAHCCENSGPDQAKSFIPPFVIKKYIRDALADPTFSRSVVFTGGEIMSAYDLFGVYYVPYLLGTCREYKLSTDIKTNAAWVNGAHAQTIFNDLHHAITNTKPYSIQVSLSLDKYHPDSIKNNAAIIKKLAKLPNARAMVNVSYFDGDEKRYDELLKHVVRDGVDVSPCMILSNNQLSDIDMAGDLILKKSVGKLFDGGRAKNLPNAGKTAFPQFKFMSSDFYTLMAFDSFGRVALGESSGRKIGTHWRKSNGCPRDFWEIRDKLVSSAQYEELRARILHNWKPKQK